MLAFLPFLLLVPSTLASLLPTVGDHSHTLDSRDSSAVSPNKTCGLVGAGLNGGYTCASTEGGPCCSQYGYCGTGDTYCLTSGGCQAKYSNASTSCYTPKAGVTVSIDGTCGITGAGKVGYRCNTTGQTCCSVAGYCGNTTEHCDVNNGCQSGYGTCTGTLKSTRRENRAKPVTLNLDIPE